MSAFLSRVRGDAERDAALLGQGLSAWKAEAMRPTADNPLRPLAARVGRVSEALGDTLRLLPEVEAGLEPLARRRRGLAATARVWEFFAGRFRQRFDPQTADLLRLADRFARECWEPVAAALEPGDPRGRREPPLVAFTDEASPVVVPRVRAVNFPGLHPDEVTRLGAVIRALPVPVVGMPWWSAPDARPLVLVAHEVGHVIEEDFSLTPTLRAALAPLPAATGWPGWASELFADAWGVRYGGLEFAERLTDVLAAELSAPTGGVSADPDDPHPPAALRMAVAFRLLERAGLDPGALRAEWELAAPGLPAARREEALAAADTLAALPVAGAPLLSGAAPPEVRGVADSIQGAPATWNVGEVKAAASVVRALARCTLDASATRAACRRWRTGSSTTFLGGDVATLGPTGATGGRGTNAETLPAQLAGLLFT